jgi:hypothetical protein
LAPLYLMPRNYKPAHRPCTICQHVDRALIERAKIAGVGNEAVAAKYGVSPDAVYRHMRKHVSDAARDAYASDAKLKELAKQAADDGLDNLDRNRIVNSILMRRLRIADKHGDAGMVATTSRALFEGLRDISKLTGEALQSVATITNIQNNFYQSPDYLALQAMLVERLSRHPEALRDVLAGLEALELDREAEDPRLIEAKPIEASE